MELSRLLAELADGDFHSGEALGSALGVSRTAIWKQLQKLEDIGLAVESVKGRGYRLPGGFCALNADAIQCSLNPTAKAFLSSLQIEQQINSTNTLLAERARSGDGVSGAVCVAEQQTAGRGRLGRQWISPFGRNLMFSLLWEFQNGAAALEGLSLAVGLSVAEALTDLGVAGLGLKWPNDVLCEGRKLAGVLLEMQGDAAGRCQVIIGIGLNVSLPDDAPIDQAWTDLQRQGFVGSDRNHLLAALLNRLLPMLAEFEVAGFSGFQSRWQAYDALADEPAELRRGEEVVAGFCRGVAANGALRFETPSGTELVSGGEVSLRRRQSGS
ncbi:BirA family biotin operon repressor/biotin-[acetyl-CoA-carboxylase] ligase [Litorivivens lipolytica]|uniref:Bifunctional ligase/repressor BirA n=1 Tax=Litorivivens lipolytica TaxID=1524264 RepID=A0A7W4W7Q8_9GAMM|nr:bifunctional biotin--[acetyl-CoA-carboxylase] ligase/biotin operon repressor BirA [Litorivivens lipolytica]MBB3048997.1 BirA family biotin operon repressor/biotin-[acetyl-CoA-carboxylase] ligase [Litorivivens lipolytica]